MNLFQRLVHTTLRKPGLICRFKTTERILGNIKNKKILDVGCGSGVYSIFFSKKGAYVTGLDFSSIMISLSRKNAKKENCKCKFLITNFLDFENKSKFDSLLFIGVFDYVGKKEIYKYFEKGIKLTSYNIIATFPKKFAFQAFIRYAWLKRQNCPVYFYSKKQIIKIANFFNQQVKFYDCGPIWVIEFKKN